ncbi:MAG: CDP-diacylglycerol--serine O-phosphatidyltransferase [Gammaproteobacteria bacterium]|nr:CDP-diacylglycerol--serine O-phosphatidyltransferase [Gammaproteobacteria bacterium]MYH45993.1 CDP-diacylglycerol--serine O-phosphatidyltransferase [Gammaproteobacteria bacterium]MYL14559.1 CDP-diacylglycerol--serine O-phosphatidyltransferase [Gammaproteobacteria bacterium]
MSKEQSTDENESMLPIDEHEEIVSEGGKQVRRRGVYLLPNILTLGALFAGFYAVIAGMEGNFNEAGWAILIAGVLDGLDGRIARLTRSQSAFGAEFDSLSDMVSFGMAPALIMFSWAFEPLGRLGWAASFFYMACAALRLARFNVQLGTVDKRFFMGLQSPVAAGLITFIPWVGYKYEVEVTALVAYPAAAVMVLTGLLMISNYRYFSFKVLNVKGTVPYIVLLLTLALLVVVAQNPQELLLAMCVIYAASGPAVWFYRKRDMLTSRFARTGEKPAKKSGSQRKKADKPDIED